jgi:hypothetical protein
MARFEKHDSWRSRKLHHARPSGAALLRQVDITCSSKPDIDILHGARYGQSQFGEISLLTLPSSVLIPAMSAMTLSL